MLFNNIKETSKLYITSQIKKSPKKDYNSWISVIESNLLNEHITEYNRKKTEADQEIERLYSKISSIENNFKLDYDNIKRTYIDDLNKQIDGILAEKINYETIVSGSASMIEHMQDFQKTMKNNVKEIQNFSSDLKGLQSSMHSDAHVTIKNLKKDAKKFLNEKKDYIKNEITEFYDKKEKEIEEHLSTKSTEDQDIVNEKKTGIFIKYNLIIVLMVLIIFIDFLLIRFDMGQLVNEGAKIRINVNKLKDFLMLWVAPFLFSFGILITEIVNYKIIKHKKISKLITIGTIILSIIIVFFPSIVGVGLEQIMEEQGELIKIILRFIVFLVLIPITVLLVVKYFTRDTLKLYLKATGISIKNIFSKIFQPITWVVNVIKQKTKPINKKIILSLSGLKLKFEGKYKDELDEKLELTKIFASNIDSLNSKINEIKLNSNLVLKQFKGGNKIFKQRVDMLKSTMTGAFEKIKLEMNQLDKQKEHQIEQIKEEIHNISIELGKDEEEIDKARILIKEGVLEALNELQEND